MIKLPYQQGKKEREFSMYIFLPDAHDGLFELTKKFFAEPSVLQQHLPTEKRHVDLRVPSSQTHSIIPGRYEGVSKINGP